MPTILLVVAAIHALPLVGVLGASQLSRLYGLPINDAYLEIVLRHRAVLFGLLATFLGYAAFKPELHRLALVAGVVSVSSFLVLSALGGPYNQAISTVVRVDWVALVLLVVAGVTHRRQRGDLTPCGTHDPRQQAYTAASAVVLAVNVGVTPVHFRLPLPGSPNDQRRIPPRGAEDAL